MRRRTFVTTACASTLAATAGCLSSGVTPAADETRHPFADSTLSIRIDNDSDTDHDTDRIAQEALDFWEEHSHEYVDFAVEFTVVDDDEPDIVIVFADDPSGCASVEGYSERVLGCAPLIRPGRQVRRPVTAHVVAGNRPTGKIRVTTKHELGHIFGLDHDDEPRWIMSQHPEDRIPLYDERVEIWETVTEAQQRGQGAGHLFNEGVQAWQRERFEQAENHFLDAHSEYGEMRSLFAAVQERTTVFDGHPRVETVNLSRLRTLLSALYRRASAAEWFTWHMAEACRGALAGDRAAVTAALTGANDWIREYNDTETTEMREVAIALGLVRGFDRDDDVLDSEADEFDPEDGGRSES